MFSITAQEMLPWLYSLDSLILPRIPMVRLSTAVMDIFAFKWYVWIVITVHLIFVYIINVAVANAYNLHCIGLNSFISLFILVALIFTISAVVATMNIVFVANPASPTS